MGAASTRLLTPRAALVLGRVSNLPTVLSNALAGIALVSSGFAVDAVPPGTPVLAFLVLALLYIGGMYLNDAFDAGIDAVERPQRPIPSGNAARWLVFALGFALLAAGGGAAAAVDSVAGGVALVLAAVIVLYDVTHKYTALAPVIMGGCRLFAYAAAAVIAVPTVDAPLLWLAAGGLLCHVVGLTYAAKREAYNSLGSVWPLAVLVLPVVGLAVAAVLAASPLTALMLAVLITALAVALRRLIRRAPGDVPKAVGLLIAAIALYDAGVIAACGAPLAVVVTAFFCFPLTLAAQRIVPGT